VPSGRTTMVFTLRGPPSGMESSAEATATGSAPPTACVVGVARSVVATEAGMPPESGEGGSAGTATFSCRGTRRSDSGSSPFWSRS